MILPDSLIDIFSSAYIPLMYPETYKLSSKCLAAFGAIISRDVTPCTGEIKDWLRCLW